MTKPDTLKPETQQIGITAATKTTKFSKIAMDNQLIQYLGGWGGYLTTIDGKEQDGTVRLYGTATHWHLLLNMEGYGGGQLARFSTRAIEIGCSRIMAVMDIPKKRRADSSQGRFVSPRLNLNFGTSSKKGIEVPFPGSFLMTIWAGGRVCTVRFAHVDWIALQLASRQYPPPEELQVFCESATELAGQLIDNRVEAVFPVQNDGQIDILSYVMANNCLANELIESKKWKLREYTDEYYQPERWGKKAIINAHYERKLLSRASKAALNAEVKRHLKRTSGYTVAADSCLVIAQPVVVQRGWHQETGLHWALVEHVTRKLPKVRTPGQLTMPQCFLNLKKAKAKVGTCEIGWFDRENLLFTVAAGPQVPYYRETWSRVAFLLPAGCVDWTGQVWEPGEYEILSDNNLIYKLPAAILRRPLLRAYERRRQADQDYESAWGEWGGAYAAYRNQDEDENLDFEAEHSQ